MFCKNCGEENKEEANFCIYCGEEQKIEIIKKSEEQQKEPLKVEPFSKDNFWKNILIIFIPGALLLGLLRDPDLFGDEGILIFAILAPGLIYLSEFLRQKINSIITFIILLLASFFILGIAVSIVNSSDANNTDMGWTEREVQDYTQTCMRVASAELYYIDDYKISLYCSCTLREVMYLYPFAPPPIEEYGRPDVERKIREVQVHCLDLAL